MQQIIDIIRKQPISGKAPDGNGNLQPTTINTATLIYLIDYAGFGPPVYRDLDAAARAWLDSKDALPFLRLVAEADTASVDLPEAFSYGLYEAVTCSDYPLLYNLYEPRDIRDEEYADGVEHAREHRPGLFAPFTVDEGIDSQVYISPLNSCRHGRYRPRILPRELRGNRCRRACNFLRFQRWSCLAILIPLPL